MFDDGSEASPVEAALTMLLEGVVPHRWAPVEFVPGQVRVREILFVTVPPEGAAASDAQLTPAGLVAADSRSSAASAPQDDKSLGKATPVLDGWAQLLEEGAEQLERALAAHQAMSRAAGEQAAALAAFARLRPTELDRAPGEPGAASAATRAARPAALSEVSEWAVAEVSATLAVSDRAASSLLAASVTLDEALPSTLAALRAGSLSWAHAGVLADVVGPVTDPAIRAGVEARVLSRLGAKSPGQLREAAHRAVLRADAEAAVRRAAAAIRRREVRLQPGCDGLDVLYALLPAPVARAVYDALERLAEICTIDGDERTKGERMGDCLADLVLRPGSNGLPPVQAQLTVVALADTLLGGNEPAEVNGQVLPAALVRELAYQLGLLPRPASDDTGVEDPAPTDPAGSDPAGSSQTTDVCEPHLQPDAAETATSSRSGTQPTEPRAHDVSSWAASVTERAAGKSATARPATSDAAAAVTPTAEPGRAQPAGSEPALSEPTTAEPTTAEPTTAKAPTAERPGWNEAAGEDVGISTDAAPSAETAALELARAALGDLLSIRTIADTSLVARPHIAIADALTGSLIALTDAASVRGGRSFGPPPDTDGYRPSAALDRFVRARDRRCRFPGCRARPHKGDLDHLLPHGCGGLTSCANLAALCRFHHRLSHQAPGWAMRTATDGGIAWTLPGGRTITTYPPAFGADDDLPPEPPPRSGEPSPDGTADPPPY